MDANLPHQSIQAPTLEQIDAMIANHAPVRWDERFNQDGRLAELIHQDRQFMLMVLAADIRNSTLLQKEAISFRIHAAIMTRFVEAAGDTIRVIGGGWFDKFMGDGFLAYWVLDVMQEGEDVVPLPVSAARGEGDASWTDIQAALTAAFILHWSFDEKAMDDFRANSQNVPHGTGLAIGVDVGPAHFATVAGDLTILGTPVVGATRMVSVAKAGEIVANVQLGQLLAQRHERRPLFGLKGLRTEVRPTKEFPSGQEIYVLESEDDQIAGLNDPVRAVDRTSG